MLGLPNTFKVHWTYLHHVTSFFTLQNTIAAASSHSSDVEKFRAVDEVIV